MKTCLVEGCDRTDLTKGYCNKHYKRHKRYGDPLKLSPKHAYPKICQVEDCNNNSYVKGYCPKHYRKFLRYGDPLKVLRKRNICTVEGCNKLINGRGFCMKHYKRYMKYGSPRKLIIERHNMSDTLEYGVWLSMKRRCSDPKNNRYYLYGGRGIRVCDQWKDSFITFYEDMGPRPFPKAQIDRIDNDGNYEPGNCRWVTPKENANNRSTSVKNHI